MPELRARMARLQEALRASMKELENDLKKNPLPPDLEERTHGAHMQVVVLKVSQEEAEKFISESRDLLAKEVSSDVKGFEEFDIRLTTIKLRLGDVREPLGNARTAIDALATNYPEQTIFL